MSGLQVGYGSSASVLPDHGDFRSTPVNGPSQDRRARLKGHRSGKWHTAKKPETRARRIAQIVAKLDRGDKVSLTHAASRSQ
ncbi:YdeI/OmpD-associated family protein [Bradyrhizobium sp. WSM1743]|uniref:YdeI/OmpD-associated family protein n=1 Tax=Bradyrhizobium sp. WSM1743 TaxID=318996 RepID=UPI0012EC4048